MNRETLIWTILFIAGAAGLAWHTATAPRGVGQQYVIANEVTAPIEPGAEPPANPDSPKLIRYGRYDKLSPSDPKGIWSPSRTAGIWIAAFLTLCALSYVYRDNVFYKLAESIIVGVSAGYWIVLNFWEVLVAKVMVKLLPDMARYAFAPDTPLGAKPEYLYVIPVILGCLVFCRLIPKISWLGRWPLAFVVGTTAGLKLILFLDADFVQQVRSTVLPLIVFAGSSNDRVIDWKQSIQNLVLIISVVSSLTYFYFSVEQKGLIGRIARLGIWVLMISFGASFALTVMGRITLLTMRLQFLYDGWLGLVQIQ